MRLFAAFVLLAFTAGSAACKAPVPLPDDPKPRLEWDWAELDQPMEGHIDSIAFSADAKLVAAGAKDTIGVWSVETRKQISRMRLPKFQNYIRLMFAADGKSLVSDCREDSFVRFWDVKTGKQLREFERPKPSKDSTGEYSSTFLAFAPGAGLMVEHKWGGEAMLRLTDLATGAARTAAPGPDSDNFAEVAFAPDGKTFALNGPRNQLRVFDIASGKLVRELQPPFDRSKSWSNRGFVRYSPDGQYLIACEHTGRVETFDKFRYAIWGVADGKRLWENLDRGGTIGAGNRYVLTDTKAVRDLLTDEMVPIGKAPDEGRHLAGMSPDGTLLAFLGRPSGDARGMKWAIYLTPAPVLPPPIRVGDQLSGTALAKVWAGVVSEHNLFRREHCIRVLMAKPAQAVDAAQGRLKPVPAADAERMAKLFLELDDDAADVRDKAQAELQEAGHRFEATLAAALKAAPAGEVRNRLTSITQKTGETPPPADLVTDLLAIAFLERLDTPAAREVLKAVAGGAPGARITAAAVASLAKLSALKR